MRRRRDVRRAFNRFAGREVPMKDEVFTVRGRVYHQIRPANGDDPVLKDMRAAAEKRGLKLRVLWPGLAAHGGKRGDRINARIEKGRDGRWRVSPKFDIG